MSTTIYPSYNPQPSDNELEYSLPTNPPTVTDDDLNLSVLRRHLPSTTSIAFLAPYAVIYIYSTATNGWEKNGIEGTLFVVELQNEKYAVLVLNRRGLNNFTLPLKSAEDVEITQEYVILEGIEGDGLRSGNVGEKKVYGIWIFEEEQGSTRGVREACGRCIVECAEKAGKDHGIGVMGGQANGFAQEQVTAGASSGPDLMALLNPSRGRGST